MSGRRIFLGRLSYRASEHDIERFFKGYGRINSINIKPGYCFVEFDDSRDADDAVHDLNNSTLCGERVNVEHAVGVPRNRDHGGGYGGGHGGGHGGGYGGGYGGGNGGGNPREFRDSSGRPRPSYFHGRAIGKYGPPVRSKYRLIVENLSTRVSWQDLKDYLRQAGDITYADAHKHRRNEGVVDFSSYEGMKRAIEELDGTEINGRRIRLTEDKSARETSRSRSRSYTRSRSKSPRSRSNSPTNSDTGNRS